MGTYIDFRTKFPTSERDYRKDIDEMVDELNSGRWAENGMSHAMVYLKSIPRADLEHMALLLAVGTVAKMRSPQLDVESAYCAHVYALLAAGKMGLEEADHQYFVENAAATPPKFLN